MCREISIRGIEPHPENPDHMDQETLKKLRRLIEHTGKYEPLVVRRRPTGTARFQLVGGYNRLRALQAIGHRKARCVIWDVDDDEARLHLATLSRLPGKDIPERRAVLLERLLRVCNFEELALLLPDTPKQLGKLSELARIDPGPPVKPDPQGSSSSSRRYMVSFCLSQEQAAELDLALNVVISASKPQKTRSEALTGLADLFLRNCTARDKE